MPEIVTIRVDDSKVYDNVMDYFNLLPLPTRTSSEALVLLKKKVEVYTSGETPESWKRLTDQPDVYAPKHTNALVYLYEQIEMSDNRDDLLSGGWTQLVSHLSSLDNIVRFGNRANTRESNMVGVKNALSGIADAMNDLDRTLELNLPEMAIQ